MSGLTMKQILSIPARYPLSFGVGLSTVKTSVSDLLVQKVVQQREEIDWKRNFAFATFGCFYLGGVQYALYVPIFGRMFPNAAPFAAKSFREKIKDTKGIFALTAQVFLDQCVHHPFLYFPVFYCTKEIVMSEKPDFVSALSNYRENMKEDLMALWKIWVPATFVNFAVMPMWGRIPWVAGTSFLWTMILSMMRGGAVSDGEELAGNAVDAKSLQLFSATLNDYLASHTTAVDLDKTKAHVVVSASGPDRVGWVGAVARSVAENGGNVTHSKMVRLGQEFTILMHVDVEPHEQKKLIDGLRKNKELAPLNVRVSGIARRQTGMYIPATFGLKIHCVGEDRPGMLASIAEAVSTRGMNIENISTELRRGPEGRVDFVVNTDVTHNIAMTETERNALIEDLKLLKTSLRLDVIDIRVQKI